VTRIYIQEVAPRDGLQNEDVFVETEDKIAFINRLGKLGLSKIEVTAFVSPKAVHNLKDAEFVMQNINRNPDVTYSALVPNLKGAKRAAESNVDEINLLVSASNTHNLKNVGRTTENTFNGFKEIISFLNDKDIQISGAIGTSFGCPFQGRISYNRVLSIIEKYADLGVTHITLADTTGMATPKQVYELCTKITERWDELTVTLHFHNTRGMGLANVLAGIQTGITHFDASLGGIGGCPFAPEATGNISTEDLVHMLEFMDFETNVHLDELIADAKYLEQLLGHEVPGQVMKAGKITDLYKA